jgi:hypothetical protein
MDPRRNTRCQTSSVGGAVQRRCRSSPGSAAPQGPCRPEKCDGPSSSALRLRRRRSPSRDAAVFVGGLRCDRAFGSPPGGGQGS